MDGGGEWGTLKYAGGVQDKTITSGIMLRFRPIAPKPVAGDPSSSGPLDESKNGIVLSKRKKRKYVRVSKNSGNRRRKRIPPDPVTGDRSKDIVTTLPLMPEKADLDGKGFFSYVPENPDSQMCLSLKMDIPVPDVISTSADPETTAVLTQKREVETWVMVDSLTGTCMDDGALGRTDVEKMKNLEKDTCPGFISDGINRVLWVNDALKVMVAAGYFGDGWGGPPPPNTVVRLMMKEGLSFPPQYVFRTFSCHVRVVYTCQKDKNSKIVPCDVWRMECGGLAWRLDVKAALSLGL